MSILKELEKDLKSILNNDAYKTNNLYLEPSNRKDLGEYQLNDAMQLAKIYKENPHVIAEKIKNELEKNNHFTNINIAGPGFINLSLSNDYIIEIMNRISEDIFENIDLRPKKRIIIDFGGANVSKALHVGHLRSANLGEALKRLGRLLGQEVIGDAHLGDYGRPLGLVVLEIKKMYSDLPYFDDSYKGDYSEVRLPITNEDLEKIYPLASTKSKTDENYLEEAREITVKIQKKERGYYDLWKKVVEISKKDIKSVYDDLNVEYDLWLGESDAVEHFEELKAIFEEKNLLTESENAQIVNIDEENDNQPMPPLLFIKSNGSISYETTDLATILERKKDYNPDEIWYVVDARQSLHFEQVFRAARKAKLVADEVNLEFIGFGTMNGKDGKPFKTRDGGVMTLKSLIELVRSETYKKINSNIVDEEEKLSIANKVAIATLKYADFIPYRGTDYIFEVEKFADLEGKTGPYLLYSTIRMKSLLAKADYKIGGKIKVIKTPVEKEIALAILGLPTVLNKAFDTRSLNEIAEYLYKLTSLYNKFYAENKVLTEREEAVKTSWLVLTKTVYNINIMLLNILGIEVPDKM